MDARVSLERDLGGAEGEWVLITRVFRSLRQSWPGACPLERERPLGVTFSAPSCISQACVVEQVSGGDGQAAWPPGAVEFRGGPSRFALPLGLPLSLLQIMTFIEHLLNTRL